MHPPKGVQSYGDGVGQDLPEELLVQRASLGDPAAFGWLARRHQDALFNTIYRITGNQDLAYDVVQESFLKAYNAIAGFRSGSRFYTWLYRIALNTLRSHWRKEGRRPGEQSLTEDPPDLGIGQGSDDPAIAAQKKEMEQIIQQSISALPDPQREILVLRDVEQLEYDQIAEILDLSLGTVKSRLHRARMTLKEKLRHLWEGDL